MARLSRLQRLGRGLTLSGAVPALCLVVVELGLRAFTAEREAPPLRFRFANRLATEAEGLEDLYRPSATRFWELEPGAVEPFGGDAISARGMRGPELADVAQPGVLRVAALGDSCTYGVFTGLAHTWPARLGERLAELFPAATFEVVNAGVPGYSVFQGGVAFRELVAPLRPDLVVLYFGAWNDWNPAFGASDRERAAGAEGGALERLYGLATRTRIGQALGRRLVEGRAAAHREALVEAWKHGASEVPYRVPAGEFTALLDELTGECEALGARVVVVLPELSWARKAKRPAHFARLDRYRDAARRVAHERGVAVVDLRELFPPGLHPELFTDIVHPGPRGLLWLAHEVAAVVVREGLLPSAGEPVALEPGRVRIDAGAEFAGRPYRVRVSQTPTPYAPAPGAPSVPLEEDALSALYARGGDALSGPSSGTLDEQGVADFVVSFDPAAPKMSRVRAIGIALAVGDDEGDSSWTPERWLRVE